MYAPGRNLLLCESNGVKTRSRLVLFLLAYHLSIRVILLQLFDQALIEPYLHRGAFAFRSQGRSSVLGKCLREHSTGTFRDMHVSHRFIAEFIIASGSSSSAIAMLPPNSYNCPPPTQLEILRRGFCSRTETRISSVGVKPVIGCTDFVIMIRTANLQYPSL